MSEDLVTHGESVMTVKAREGHRHAEGTVLRKAEAVAEVGLEKRLFSQTADDGPVDALRRRAVLALNWRWQYHNNALSSAAGGVTRDDRTT